MMVSSSTLHRELPRTMLAFDFDWTLIDEDSDTFLLECLSPPALEEFHETVKTLPWIYAINEATQKLCREGFTRSHVAAALNKIRMKRSVVDMLHHAKEQGADLYVISDANTFTIRHVLQRHGLLDLFSEIIANPATWTDGVADDNRIHSLLSITPYNPAVTPHGCSRASSVTGGKTCYKGKVLNAILGEPASRDQVLARLMYWSKAEDLASVVRIALTMCVSTVPAPSPLVNSPVVAAQRKWSRRITVPTVRKSGY
ncbi:hypothetical protein IWQ60_004456 [Tieghemiomyces parasiticus]|uniref:Uncharacterized protein n=1 Tax=Tieghemiomyces parasiticus TaxID=78921 RepID=A0A9W8DZB8_9FUNG|nr:hypothetical protein IWQ60_004456 [Tieghemiomyces parasiticus]